jgi:hypothetical protein
MACLVRHRISKSPFMLHVVSTELFRGAHLQCSSFRTLYTTRSDTLISFKLYLHLRPVDARETGLVEDIERVTSV